VAPPHTAAAFEAALAQGADGLAVDVRLTADAQVVAAGGPRLDGPGGPPAAVGDRTLRELKRLELGRGGRGWLRRGSGGHRPQALGEVVERFRGRADLLVVLPGGSDVFPGIEDRVLDVLQLADPAARVAVASADHHALRRCRARDPELVLVALVGARPLDPAALAGDGPGRPVSALGLPADLLARDDVERCRHAGLACQAWGADDPARAREVARWGLAALVTGRPDLLRAALGR
jgi:glycerophosphoryl diester phosphodiesterase